MLLYIWSFYGKSVPSLFFNMACINRNTSLQFVYFNCSHDAGKYALYCSRSIERALSEGDREARPSRPEVGIFPSIFWDKVLLNLIHSENEKVCVFLFN